MIVSIQAGKAFYCLVLPYGTMKFPLLFHFFTAMFPILSSIGHPTGDAPPLAQSVCGSIHLSNSTSPWKLQHIFAACGAIVTWHS
jgi:hypothetical protein